jgi:hypothetical protein
MIVNKPAYFEIRFSTDLLLLILLLALLALPVASLGISGVKNATEPQVAGTSTEVVLPTQFLGPVR